MNCPTPFKRSFDTKGDAQNNLGHASREVGDSPDHIYHCECGGWHIAGSTAMVRDTTRKRNHRTKGGPKRYRRRHQRRGCL